MFIGEYNLFGLTSPYKNPYNLELPDGFIKCVSLQGNIHIGNFTSDFVKDGWCISFMGQVNCIYVGWYKNNKRHGNWMVLHADDLTTKVSGFYQEDEWASVM